MISKQEWTHKEDQLLMDLAKTMTRRWSKIAKSIPGRTGVNKQPFLLDYER